MIGRWHSWVLLGSSNSKLQRCPSPSPSPSPSPLSFFCTVAEQEQEWSGLQGWRERPLDERREWGEKGRRRSSNVYEAPKILESMKRDGVTIPCSLSEWGALILNTPDPSVKVSLTHHAFRLWSDQKLPLGAATPPNQPARPRKPLLVSTLPPILSYLLRE